MDAGHHDHFRQSGLLPLLRHEVRGSPGQEVARLPVRDRAGQDGAALRRAQRRPAPEGDGAPATGPRGTSPLDALDRRPGIRRGRLPHRVPVLRIRHHGEEGGRAGAPGERGEPPIGLRARAGLHLPGRRDGQDHPG